jgi:hypothetical protein
MRKVPRETHHTLDNSCLSQECTRNLACASLFLSSFKTRLVGSFESRLDLPNRNITKVEVIVVAGFQRLETELLGDDGEGLGVHALTTTEPLRIFLSFQKKIEFAQVLRRVS